MYTLQQSNMSMSSFDTFLPSGAVEQRYQSPGTMASASIPRSVPPSHYPNFPKQRGRFSPSSPHTGTPISPPKTRSASADENSATLVEDWRTFTKKIREQARGERAHLLADRARADEVMEEERQLWEQERSLLKARIDQLEKELASRESGASSANKSKSSLRLESIAGSRSGSSDMSPASSIPQESGRNPDGSPFYAPAPRNPSRSFNPGNQELRIDSITGPRETPIRVTSKALRPVDFGIQSPERQAVQDTSHGIVGESIDISLIQPTLEGVPIKTSAVDPIFAATVLSPQASASPSKRSPTAASPEDERGPSPPGTVRRNFDKKICTLEVRAAPEGRRLTMHAGHTPNHSISKFELESGNATPTQSQSVLSEQMRNNSTAADTENDQEGGTPDYHDVEDASSIADQDPELSGPLGFSADPTSPENDVFARELVKRLSREALLQEMRGIDEESIITEDSEESKDQVVPNIEHRKEIPSVSSVGSDDGESGSGGGDDTRSPPIDGLPKLRMKPSVNFGKPFGSL